MTIGQDHALASTGKIQSSAKLPCHYVKQPSDQINPELVSNVFKKYCILDSMDGTKVYKYNEESENSEDIKSEK